jgi:hypothetical protein
MRNVSDKSCRENQSTYFMFSNFSGNTATYETRCKKYGTAVHAVDDNTYDTVKKR